MSTAYVAVDVKTTGPLLTGNPAGVITDMVREILSAVADQASANVHTNAETFFRHPTPYYETQIHRFRQGITEAVGDRGVVYGPWLEGTSRRNETTRFKGYHLWRLAMQRTQAESDRLTRPIVTRYMSKLSG